GEGGRPADPAADQARIRAQPQDRPRARADGANVDAASGRRGDRMTHTPIGRREFVALLGAGAAVSSCAWPLAAQQRNMPVIGWLSGRTAAADAPLMPGFRQGLNARGFVEGRNLTIEHRYADLQPDRLPALAADLVRRQASVVVVVGESIRGPRAAQAASATIPIVAILGPDPVKDGFAASINRPGGNITGVISFPSLVAQKRLGLLHDLLPRANMIAVLTNPADESSEEQATEVRDAARILGLQTQIVAASTEADIYSAFTSFAQMRPDALFVTANPLFYTNTDRIVALAMHLG